MAKKSGPTRTTAKTERPAAARLPGQSQSLVPAQLQGQFTEIDYRPWFVQRTPRWLRRFLGVLLGALAIACIVASLQVIPESRDGAAIGVMMVLTMTFGLLLGRSLYWRRSQKPSLQVLSLVVVPLAVTIPLTILALGERWFVFPLFLPAFAFGAWLIARREDRRAPRLATLTRAWRGVSIVGKEGNHQFRISALLGPVTRAEARSVTLAPVDRGTRRTLLAAMISSTILAWLAPIGVLAFAPGFVELFEAGGNDAASQGIGMSFVVALLIAVGIFAIWFSAVTRARHISLRDCARLQRFASDNHLEFRPFNEPAPAADERLTRVLKHRAKLPWTLANREALDFTRASTMFGGSCRMLLPRNVPNVLLRRRTRLRRRLALYAPRRAQRLELDPEFAREIEAYCAPSYTEEARALFTPEIIRALFAESNVADVEVIGNQLQVRTRRELVTLDPARWVAIARLLDTMTDCLDQWRPVLDRGERPRAEASLREDFTLDAKPISPEGRRLRVGIEPGGYVALGIGLAIAMLMLSL